MPYRHPYRRQPCRRKRGPLPLWLRRPREYYQYNQKTTRGYDYWRVLYWATPPWLSDEQIRQMAALHKRKPRGYHVHHIVPLVNSYVCGLNVPWNLEIIPAARNMHLSNHTWPDSPHDNHDLFGIGVEQLEMTV